MEWVTAKVEYVPDLKYLELCSYREYFRKEFNKLIEEIAEDLFDEIWISIRPAYLKVTVFLEGNPNLSDWKIEINSNER